MREITKQMIKIYGLKQIGHDFMGYSLQKNDIYTFHHLIVPHRECKSKGLGEGYLKWNGAILCGSTSHPYLHLIESKDYELFLYLTSELIDINLKNYVDSENIKKIDSSLRSFEREHCSDKTKKGKILIKPEYVNRIKKN